MRATVLGAFVASALIGCVSLIPDLQRESARGIDPHPYPDSVTVSDVRHHGDEWVATTSSGVFDCSKRSDEDYALCIKRQTPR